MVSTSPHPSCATYALKFCAALSAFWLAGGLAAPADDARAAESVLVVPPSPVALNVAVAPDAAAKPDGPGPWQLVEVGGSDLTVPVQLVPALSNDGLPADDESRLVAVIPPGDAADQPRRFALRPASQPPADARAGFRLEDADQKSLKIRLGDVDQQSLKIWDGDSPVLVYNHGMVTKENVPETDPRRTRACYVHPVWGLNGEILTDDFPRDHYHHHGIFWTWPHVKIEGQEYDLWADRGIQQRFVKWLCKEAGPVAAVIGVENGWFVDDKKVMIERVWLRAYKPFADARCLDLEFAWIPVDKPITLCGAAGKSYGGLTVRFAPPSRSDPNTVITVPGGPTTADLPDTPLAWADFTSKLGDCPTRSGAAVFVHPNHPDYPPTWLTRHYGPLCIGWPGVKPKTFEPGKPIRLDYRIWIHKGPVETAQIQQAYDAYATRIQGRQP